MNRVFAIILVLFTTGGFIYSQEDVVEDLLNERILNENPVYKPMVGISSGVFNFLGDVNNNYSNPVLGDKAYKINISTYLDVKRYLKLNLNFLYGKVSGNERSLTDTTRNLNFETDLVNFGINLEYSFEHILKKNSLIKPFVSIGIENLQFSPKGDLYTTINDTKINYHYWSDGSIRDISEFAGDASLSSVIYQDYNYETNLRQNERQEFNLGNYSQNTFAIPVDFGLNMKISERVNLKLGSSFHITFSDFIDNVSSVGTSVVGKKGNDILIYNYIGIDFDLFSEPKTVIIEKMFAEMEFDAVMFDDEDGDFILDAVDECPGTPYGVVTDTLGCPLDEDKDGIPDYLDKEKFSSPGAWVDDNGVSISEEDYLIRLLNRNEAMGRSDVIKYFETIGKSYVRKSVEGIPDKFKSLDTDNDGYISFEELLQGIDNYFDQKLSLSVEDIYELNNFFFSQ
ncbi:MAG: hypothetical protein K9H49_00725 [Bacteroidales bacterium]|nr:hypothetical protein [Bacteroidales bacterium]MCF8389440.1 hypothetical protein [Bacteroidales bacterium]